MIASEVKYKRTAMDEKLQSNTCILPSSSSSTVSSTRFNMKFLILAALLAVAAAGTIPYGSAHTEAMSYGAGQRETMHATILSESDIRNEDGSSSFSYASSDSINREEKQQQKQTGTGTGTVNQGSTQYVAPDGQQISMSWVADENGFQPSGSHLPTPPPIPAEIAAMLPTLPRLTHEQLYGGDSYATPGMTAYTAPKYETPKYVAPKIEMPKYEAPKYQVPTAPVPTPTTYRKNY